MATPTLNLELVINARRMKQGADEAKRAAREVGQEAKGAAAQVDRLEAEIGQTGRQAERTAPRVRRVGEEVRTAGERARRARRDFTQAQTAMAGIGGAAGLAMRAVGGLTAGFTAFAAARRAISTIVGFDESLAQLQAVTGASGSTLDALSTAARQAGATTRYTAVEAAQGLLELSKAGLTAEQSIKGLTPALNLATFASTGLAESAEMLVNVAAQFGLEAKGFERIGDVLVKAANISTSNVTDLAQGLRDVGVVGKQVGLDLEDVVAALGLLGQRGLKGSDGAIKLRQAFLQLLDPSRDAQVTLSRMGLSLDDVDIRTRGLVPVLKSLRDAQLDIVEAAQLVDTRNAAALIELANGVDEYEKMRGALDGVAGSMEKASEILNQSLAGKWKELGSAFDEVALSAEGLGGMLANIVSAMTSVVRLADSTVDALAKVGQAPPRTVSERGRMLPSFLADTPPPPWKDPYRPFFQSSGAFEHEQQQQLTDLLRRAEGIPPYVRPGGYDGFVGPQYKDFSLEPPVPVYGPPGDTPFRSPATARADSRAQEADASVRMLSSTMGDLASSAIFAAGNIRELMSSLVRPAVQNFARTAFTTAFESVLGGTAGQQRDAAANAASGNRGGAGGF